MPAGDDHHVGAGRGLVAVAADDARVGAQHRAGLQHVQGLALGKVLYDVDQDDVGISQLVNSLGGSGADVAGADHGYLAAHVPFSSRGQLQTLPLVGDIRALPRLGGVCSQPRRPWAGYGALAGPS